MARPAKSGPRIGLYGKKKRFMVALSTAARLRLRAIARNEECSMSAWLERQIMLCAPRSIRMSRQNGGQLRKVYQRAAERSSYWSPYLRRREDVPDSDR